ncbi:ribosomal-protein-alanine N-acetyltransferase [Comamonas serinivorans]|uniref:[Ribosomal protein bS18]-alanine N-acetyltransferase n=1 Tax=Comamonas serinivorans TaxID=1082851 RepID=A0A1Y0ET55_9BURK|nr:ribosomal protein S18-alanine N-acetyltransferase [Comamonas serinivorans]ARU06561.1 ribosomal-protein-alanine N-acetyltransferase [Comamonas serinivorans]
MTPADLPAVLAVEQAAYSHPWTTRNLQDAMGAGNLAQLLWAGEVLAGYFVAMPGVDEVHLLNITVAPALQRRGLAQLMLQMLGLWALHLDKPWVWLEVRRSNARAIAVYERHGFKQVGVRKGYYPAASGQREDAIVMTLALPAPRQEPA